LSATTAYRSETANVGYTISHPAPAPATATLVISVLDGKGKVVKSVTLRNVTIGAAHTWSFRCTLAKGTYTEQAVATDANGHVSGKATARLLVKALRSVVIGGSRPH